MVFIYLRFSSLWFWTSPLVGGYCCWNGICGLSLSQQESIWSHFIPCHHQFSAGPVCPLDPSMVFLVTNVNLGKLHKSGNMEGMVVRWSRKKSSLLRKRESKASITTWIDWIPAFAGMTRSVFQLSVYICENLCPIVTLWHKNMLRNPRSWPLKA